MTALSERSSKLPYTFFTPKGTNQQESTIKHFKMTRTPATPQKSNRTFSGEASKVAVPYLDKLASSAKGKERSPQEPSPASTYGDTAAGDSVPVTPLVIGACGKSATSPRWLLLTKSGSALIVASPFFGLYHRAWKPRYLVLLSVDHCSAHDAIKFFP